MSDQINKIPKYLIESLVIIASILGAFALDRWYENYQQEQRIQRLILEVRRELLYDISELNPRIESNYHRHMHIDSIISTEINSINLVIPKKIDVSAILLSDKSYLELINHTFEVPRKYQNVMNLLNQLYGRFSARIIMNVERTNDLNNMYFEELKNMEWFKELHESNTTSKSALEYVRNNPAAYLLLYRYKEILQAMMRDMLVSRTLALSAVMEMDEINPMADNSLIATNNSLLVNITDYNGTYKTDNKTDSFFVVDGVLFRQPQSDNYIYSIYEHVEDDLFMEMSGIEKIRFNRDNEGNIISYSNTLDKIEHMKVD